MPSRGRSADRLVSAVSRCGDRDHLEQTETDGIAAMKRPKCSRCLLPGSVYSLGKTRYPRAREMIEAGLAVVLATDFNPGSSPTPSMPMVLSLAATQMKMSPAEESDRADDQRGLQFGSRRQDWLAGSRKARQFCDLRLRKIIASSRTTSACRRRIPFTCAASVF